MNTNTTAPIDFEQAALLYAERYGIIDYAVRDGKMVYRECFPSGTYEATVDLTAMKETRKQIR